MAGAESHLCPVTICTMLMSSEGHGLQMTGDVEEDEAGTAMAALSVAELQRVVQQEKQKTAALMGRCKYLLACSRRHASDTILKCYACG